VWVTARLWENIRSLMMNLADFASFFFNILANLQQQQIINFAMMLWCI
jgi:hypothetical protein